MITVSQNVRDGNRALVRRDRLKIDPCGSKSGLDRNLIEDFNGEPPKTEQKKLSLYMVRVGKIFEF